MNLEKHFEIEHRDNRLFEIDRCPKCDAPIMERGDGYIIPHYCPWYIEQAVEAFIHETD